MNFCRSIWRPEVARRWKKLNFFLVFWKNDPLRENFQNSVPNVFITTLIDVLCSNFVKFSRWEIGKVVHYLPDKKKFAWLSSFHYCADRAQNLPGQAPKMYSECSRLHPNRFTFGAVICERVNTVRARSKVNPIFGWSLASSQIITSKSGRRTILARRNCST